MSNVENDTCNTTNHTPSFNTTLLEIAKLLSTAFLTVIILWLFGSRAAIPACFGLFLLNHRFSFMVDETTFRRKINPEEKVADESSDAESFKNDLNQIDWLKISKLPGLDAERLKDTFEHLYNRLDKGSLVINKNGNWEDTMHHSLERSTISATKKCQ